MKAALAFTLYTLFILFLEVYWGGARVSGDEIEAASEDIVKAYEQESLCQGQNRGLRAQIRAYEREYPRKVVAALREAYRGQGGD